MAGIRGKNMIKKEENWLERNYKIVAPFVWGTITILALSSIFVPLLMIAPYL